jgi:hypothetical protein
MSLTHMLLSMQPYTLVDTPIKRGDLAIVRTEQDRRQRALRAAALAVVATMEQRPRGVWDEIARIDRPSKRFEYTQEPMRVAVHAGASIDAVCDFYCTLLLDALSAAQHPITFDEAAAALRAIREQAEAVEAAAVATARPTLANTERAFRETQDAIGAGQLYCAMMRRAQLIRRMG